MRTIYHAASSRNCQFLLAVEMAARTIKKMIFASMRDHLFKKQDSTELTFIELVCDQLNLIFQQNQNTWDTINKNICTYYQAGPKYQDFKANQVIWENIESEVRISGPKLLFAKLQKFLGLSLVPEFSKMVYNSKNLLESITNKLLLNPMVITGISGRIKHLSIISHAEGQSWKWMKDDRAPGYQKSIANQCLSAVYCNLNAATKFDEALVSQPSSVVTMSNAITYRYKYWKELQHEDLKPSQIAYVKCLFNSVINLEPLNTRTTIMYYEALLNLNLVDEAEEVLLNYLDKNPLDKVVKQRYLLFLDQHHKEEKADFKQLRRTFKEQINQSC